MSDTCATADEVLRILLASEPDDELKVTYQNQGGTVYAFIPPWNCNTWALRVLKVIRSQHENPQPTGT